jgi:hypothetical protein
MRLKNVDLPTFGLPMMATVGNRGLGLDASFSRLSSGRGSGWVVEEVLCILP